MVKRLKLNLIKGLVDIDQNLDLKLLVFAKNVLAKNVTKNQHVKKQKLVVNQNIKNVII